MTIPQAICMHEEDDGISWKHTDFRTGSVEVRRGRKLVISNIVTVGNYEYGFFWYLCHDGMIQCEIKATGIVATQAMAEGETTEYGKLVAPRLNAMHHQHFFCARLDFELDGGPNSVTETRTETVPAGPGEPARQRLADGHADAGHRAGGDPGPRRHRGALLEDR